MNAIVRLVEYMQRRREEKLGRPLSRSEQLRFRLVAALLITSPLIFVVIVGSVRAIWQ
jgi:CHASE3 domain sensor protein